MGSDPTSTGANSDELSHGQDIVAGVC
jgi:hypothetical protein